MAMVIVGAVGLVVGCAFGVLVMAVIAIDNNNEYHVESLQSREDYPEDN